MQDISERFFCLNYSFGIFKTVLFVTKILLKYILFIFFNIRYFNNYQIALETDLNINFIFLIFFNYLCG